MTYATQQDLIDRFGADELIQLTDRLSVPPAAIDADVVARALSDADALIDSYLRKRYALPLDPAPPVLVKIASDLARYNLYDDGADKDGPVVRAQGSALAWLRDVSKGLIELDDGTGDAPAASGGGQVRASYPDRVFTRDSLRGY
ncbi:phage gp36-like protein [Breoghania corrubedonensis]|uniref:Phage gp36-like protein n=1 Tax=Breoghania corrubedonensis TaxID=665038 RepID=A0A2T5VCF3_9HYPH|nr:DUF1320 domain-containing protein [Breoghania corrubedonensis]PTW61426.1 phage gp36-like protein [Breoghania corrubedonensis]